MINSIRGEMKMRWGGGLEGKNERKRSFEGGEVETKKKRKASFA